VYIKSEIVGEGQRGEPPNDPKAEIKFRNTGGGPMSIENMVISSQGIFRSSFKEAVGSSASFMLSSESTPFLESGHKGRTFEHKASIVLATFRPTDAAFQAKNSAWNKELRDRVKLQEVTLDVTFSYWYLPFLGYTCTETKTVKLC
jgi:hypothetical protein